MNYHSSTRERLKILEVFYTTTLADLPPIRTILDIACGFNPLSMPWMPLAEDTRYYAYDIYRDLTGFLSEFMKIVGVRGEVDACDVMESPPARRADLALVLKAIPCLEQVDKSAGLRLLDSVNAHHLLVSFPVHSLGGRGKGMVTNYEARFHHLVAERKWEARRFEFATELVFLVTKP
jgi:16S rRNA (guanine(1405)-N(7))-methyltransferase